MRFDEWNVALGEVFLNEGPNRPVYFSATEGELQQLSDRLGLGLASPIEDLKAALRPYSFLSFGTSHRKWEGSKTKDLPPWLPFLAAATVVVDHQTERGSIAFYPQLTEFLSRSGKIAQHEYESTFFQWWLALKRWLEDDDRHAGTRGFATWGSIPQFGPRSVIGHPYTQVLLRREERRQIDDFLSEFDHLDTEPPTARDRVEVARQLVGALRRWVRDRHHISARLRKVLEGSNADDTLSLGYVLLGRTFDELSGDQRAETSTRIVRLVPAYDDYQRDVRVVAIAPNWVRASDPVSFPLANDVLREPGDTVAVDLPVTDELLHGGIEIGEDPVARLIACRHYLMAAREWALWTSVEGALPGEELHILLEQERAAHLGLQAVPGVRGLPPQWSICGPLALDRLPAPMAEGAAASNRQLLPRLRGGLQLQSQLYLRGGEPELEVGEFQGEVGVDGQLHAVKDGSIRLSDLELDIGEHVIEVGGFDLRFETIQSLQPVNPQPKLGRDHAGVVVAVDESSDLVTGARLYPRLASLFHPGLIPFVRVFVELGTPGEIATVDGPLMAGWARAINLPHSAIEVHARSTYAGGNRLIRLPRWVAWQSDEGSWVIAETLESPTDREEGVPFDPEAWRRTCDQIGADPEVWESGRRPKGKAVVLERWRAYRSEESGG